MNDVAAGLYVFPSQEQFARTGVTTSSSTAGTACLSRHSHLRRRETVPLYQCNVHFPQELIMGSIFTSPSLSVFFAEFAFCGLFSFDTQSQVVWAGLEPLPS